jgi:hypothetical protein
MAHTNKKVEKVLYHVALTWLTAVVKGAKSQLILYKVVRKIWLEILKERDCLVDLNVEGRSILK